MIDGGIPGHERIPGMIVRGADSWEFEVEQGVGYAYTMDNQPVCDLCGALYVEASRNTHVDWHIALYRALLRAWE